MAVGGDRGKLGRRVLVGVPRYGVGVAKSVWGIGGVFSVCRGPRRRGVGGPERRRGVGGSELRKNVGGSSREGA